MTANRDRSRALVIVLDTDDVVLAEVTSGLNLDQFQEDLAGIFQPVDGSDRDVDRFVLMHDLDEFGDRHQVKRITVKAGERLSLQKHHHRSEHWIVVRGTARVTVNELVKIVHENESIYIPIGAVHRLENPGKILLELIEVQTGSYLGEDDIIRIEDDYQRS